MSSGIRRHPIKSRRQQCPQITWSAVYVCSVCFFIQGAASAEEVSDREGRALEGVTVTAQKREQNVVEVPISVTVMGGDELADGTIESLRDALLTVPGVGGYENFQAGGMTKFSVRGVSSNSSLFNGGAVVGYYLDETPFSFVRFPVSPDVNAYDLDRVEVLRGPQGTLYGASSLNGVIRVVTRSANLDQFELTGRGSASSTHDGGDNYRVDTAINIPLVPGKLALRAVAGYSDNSGWIDSVTTPEKDINGERDENLRLKLRAAPSENLDIHLTTWLRRSDGNGYATSFDNRTWNARSAVVPNEPKDMKLDSHNLIMNFDLRTFALMSSTSYLNYRNDSHFATSGDDLLTRLEAESLTQEIRTLSTSDGPWVWSLGGIYRDAEDVKYQDFLLNAFGAALSGVSHDIYTSESYAVYGELTRLLFNDRLELTAGIRYFHDRTSAQELSAFNPSTPVSGLNFNTFNATTPRAVIRYIPNDNVNFYASYSEGFRSGFTLTGLAQILAPDLSANVKPDRLHNYEVGSKGQTSDGFLTYDVAIYFMDWQDAVQSINRIIPGTTVGGFAAFNAESASGYGVDFAMTVVPIDQVQLGVTASWNDLTFDEDVLSGTSIFYPKGTRLNESPEWTASAFLNYEISLGTSYSGAISTSANYTSSIGFGAVPNQTFGNNLMTARAGFTLTSPHNWDATLFVDNFTDEDGALRFGAFVANSGDRYRPRTIGLQMNFRME